MRHQNQSKPVSTLGLSLAVAMLLANPAYSGNPDTPTSFNIPQQKLIPALTEFAEQSGVELLYSSAMAENLTAQSVKGQYSPKQALTTLLADSGISYRYVDANMVTLAKGEKAAQTSPVAAATTTSATDLPIVKVTGSVENYDNDSADPFNPVYHSSSTSTATKTDTPIMETPVSIQIVPKSVMSDQKTTTIKDALENVSSVRPQSSLGASNAYITRGFRNGRVFRNGLVANGLGIGEGTQFDSANLERVEVLKGPAAVLFGRIEPGGLVNLVTKKPRTEPYRSVEQRFGSYDFYRTEWDATDAVNTDKSLSYRFTGAYQNNKSFRDFNFNDRVLVNPSLTWRPSDATEMTLEVDAMQEEYQVDRGLFAIGNRPAPIPVTRSFRV